jgi:cell division protein FtsN
MHKPTFIVLVIALLAGGCDFIDKINPFAQSVDTLEIYRQRQDSIRRAALLERQLEEARREKAAAERADSLRNATETSERLRMANRYHLIVGSFKTSSYASLFNERIRNQGHDSRILMSDNQFHLVTIKSLDDYRSAVNELRALWNTGEHGDAWLFIEN